MEDNFDINLVPGMDSRDLNEAKLAAEKDMRGNEKRSGSKRRVVLSRSKGSVRSTPKNG